MSMQTYKFGEGESFDQLLWRRRDFRDISFCSEHICWMFSNLHMCPKNYCELFSTLMCALKTIVDGSLYKFRNV